jgi:hypothetical protein
MTSTVVSGRRKILWDPALARLGPDRARIIKDDQGRIHHGCDQTNDIKRLHPSADRRCPGLANHERKAPPPMNPIHLEFAFANGTRTYDFDSWNEATLFMRGYMLAMDALGVKYKIDRMLFGPDFDFDSIKEGLSTSLTKPRTGSRWTSDAIRSGT